MIFSKTRQWILLTGILSILSLTGCFKSPSANDANGKTEINSSDVEEYWIRFNKINSRIIVFVNGNEVFDSGVNREILHTVSVGLSKYVRSGKNVIKLDLLNGPPYDDNLGYDTYWEINYELYNQKEPIDYIHEKNEKGRNGHVWTHSHEIYAP